MKYNKVQLSTIITAVFLITSCYLLVSLFKMGLHFHIGETDTQFFFRYASSILKSGGTFDFLRDLFTGTFKSSNQHPLFPYIMTLFKSNSIDWFIYTKLFNLITGLVFVLSAFFITLTLCGVPTALISSSLLIANDNLLFQSTMVSCEPLLVLFSLFSVYYLYRGLDDNRYWIPAGIFTGLMYMTKASGLFLVFGFGLFLLYDVRLRFWLLLKNKYLWMFLLMFLVVSLPLLARNTIAFGFPFYNHNVRMLAMDRQDWFAGKKIPQVGALLDKSFFYYLKRLLFGLVEEMRIVIHSFFSFSIYYKSKFITDDHSMLQKVAASAVGVLFLAGAVLSSIFLKIEKRKKFFLLFMFLGFYLPLSWYSITSPHRRYLLPVVFIFIVPLSSGIYSSGKKIFHSFSGFFNRIKITSYADFISASVITVLAVFCVIFYVFNPVPVPSETYKLEDRHLEVASYLHENLKQGRTFFRRGNHNYAMTLFYPELEKKRTSFRRFKTFEEFQRNVTRNKKIQFILMTAETYHFCRKAIKDYIDRDSDTKYIFSGDREGLVLKKPFPGWKVIMSDNVKPVEFILFGRGD